MRLFLDTSVLLAATGSDAGAARLLISIAAAHRWQLLSADYCANEVWRNLPKLSTQALLDWERIILPRVEFIPVNVILDKPLIFAKAKDRPVLISALAADCDWLLTFDEADFHKKLGPQVYGTRLGTPGEFLLEQRSLGKF